MKSTNLRKVAYTFRSYSRKIHQKTSPADPNYLGICTMWEKIEAWAEHHYPSFVHFCNGLGAVTRGVGYRDLKLEAQRSHGEEITGTPDVAQMGKGRGKMEKGDSRTISWQLFAFVGEMTPFWFMGGYWHYGILWTKVEQMY
jgi:farnesyl-diphosphate farnesyltransferase